MDPVALRSAFPVCERVAYLNAGTDGPLPAAAAQAGREAIEAQAADGRWMPHFEARLDGQDALRDVYAAQLGCSNDDVALTTSTSEGLGKVLAGMDLGPHDEILTSDQEHPGLIGPLMAARERGVSVRTAPLSRLAEAIRRTTTVVACSHIGWLSGELADPNLSVVDVPVVYDGAQSVGAVPVDVGALRCAAYAGSGQKWLCGADGTGMLYVAPEWRDRIRPLAPGYMAFSDPAEGLDSTLHANARRHDTAALSRESVAMSLAAARLLGEFGWDAVHARARELSGRLVDALQDRGRTVGPRADTTLVAWEDPDPLAARERLGAAGVILRDLPGTSYVRASVGAWNDENDLDRLLETL